ncbi:MAG TPA: ABC transporter permease [Thermoanaerobaculia bacterium]|nr:ABC transporter permease [Thermoanaerobaculia bacterium]
MRGLRALLVRLRAIFDRDRLDRELAAELESHLAMHIDDNVRAGMTPEEARRQAILKLGGVAQTEERYRDRRGLPGLENLVRDLLFGLRMMRRNPGFTAVAVLTLGLGIGANTAIFSIVNAVLLHPLPFPRSEELVIVWGTNEDSGDTEDVTSYPNFEDWRSASRSFEGLAAFTTRGMTLSGGEQAEQVPALQVTPGFFEILHGAPALGRTFRPEEANEGAPRVAVLSDAAWKRLFGGRADVLGKTVRANEAEWTIVGVMPPGFRFAPEEQEQIYVPLIGDPNRNHGYVRVLGRLGPNVSLSAAQAEMDVIAQALERQHPGSNEGTGARVVPLLDALVGRARMPLAILLGVVMLVLLIACTNVANLLLARSATRQRELALRAALGAGRTRLLQQWLTESTLLALSGGALGLALATGTAKLLARLLAENFPIPRIENTGVDGGVLGFTLLLSIVTGLFFGTLFGPAAAARNLDETLRESGRTTSQGLSGRRLRGLLIVTETALAVVLLAAAGLLLKNLWEMRNNAPGFEPENVLAAKLWLPPSKYSESPERWRYFDEILTRAEALPNVRSAALVANLPLGGGSDSLGFHVTGKPDPEDGSWNANFNVASAGYFRTLGIPVKAGREFTKQDTAGAPGVIVINESAARSFWPEENPIGRTIELPTEGDESLTLTVVGVTADVRQNGLGTAPQPEIFLTSLQPAPPWPGVFLVFRTAGDPAALAGTVKTLPGAIDRDVPVPQIRTLDDVLSASLAQPRLYTLLLSLFAALALTLAAVGLYGVVSYMVTQRTPEMGIRLALGAGRGAVLRLVLRQGLGLALAGTAIGLVATLAVARLLSHLIPGAQPGDPLTLAAVSALLIGVALAATWFPARRASRVDPAVALRYD